MMPMELVLAAIAALSAIVVGVAIKRRLNKPAGAGRLKKQLSELGQAFRDPIISQIEMEVTLRGEFLGRKSAVRIAPAEDQRDTQQLVVMSVPQQYHLIVEHAGAESSRVIEAFHNRQLFKAGLDSLDGRYQLASRDKEQCAELMKKADLPALLDALFVWPYQTITLDAGRLTAKVWNATTDALSDPAALATRLRLLHKLSETLIQISLRCADSRKLSDVTCPYCRGAILDGLAVGNCTSCGTPYHDECWHELNRCAIFGCSGKGFETIASDG